jgi:hypothetical protein
MLTKHASRELGRDLEILDTDADLQELMARARDRYGLEDWTVWLDAPHAPGELRFTSSNAEGPYTIRRRS